MTIRYKQGSYAPGGRFFSELAEKPVFDSIPLKPTKKAFVLISMLTTSFIAHYLAPKFYDELEEPSLPKFNNVVKAGFGTAILFNLYIMIIGFLTFGGSSMGLVLNNYSGSDVMATIARFAIGVAILTGYPFTFTAAREGILDLLQYNGEKRDKAMMPFTIGLLGLVTSIALVLSDVGFVVSLSGSLFGCFLMLIVPAIMNINNIRNSASSLTKQEKLEITMNYGIITLGIVLTIIGTSITVARQLAK